MGRAILLFLAAAVLGGTLFYIAGLIASHEQGEVISAYEYDLLSQQIAISAVNIGVFEAKKDFANADHIAYYQISFRDGSFDLIGSLLASGEKGLHAIGRIGNAAHHICTFLADGGGGAIESAMIIETEEAAVEFRGNSFLVSGLNTDPPSIASPTPGANRPVHAIGVPSSTIEMLFETAPALNQEDNINGMDGNLDVYSGPSVFAVDAFYSETLTQVATTLPGGTFNGNDVYGSPDNPTVVRISGDARINGGWKGYGVLLIEGDLDLGAGDFLWEGIVMVRSPAAGEDLQVWLNGGMEIYGALIIQTLETPDPNDPVAHLEFGHQGNARILYSAGAIDRLGATFSSIAKTSPMKVYITSSRQSKTGC